MRLTALFLTLLVTLAAACSGGDDGGSGDTAAPTASETPAPSISEAPQSLPTDTVVFTNSAGESVDLTVEIADDTDERAQGLMFREELPEDSGMLFVYPDDHLGGFWMKDTLIPLSIAFVTADGVIIDIQDMEPETTESHRPPDVYRSAVEVSQGWFDRNGIAVGDTVAIPDA